VTAATKLNAFWWCWLALPKSDRALYRLIRKHKPRKLMLLGLGDASRCLRMIAMAKRYRPVDSIEFAGIDRFDSRPVEQPQLSLKKAHQLLRPTAARISLLPGDPHETLPRAANTLHAMELVVISADQNSESLARVWFFLHRLLAPGAIVLREEIAGDHRVLKTIPRPELDRLALTGPPRRRAA
jgi:hypothetical protein